MTEYLITQALPDNGKKVLCFGHHTHCCKEDMDKKSNISESDDFLKAIQPKLLQMNPNFTADNIKHTAKETGMTIEEVVQQLMSKASQGSQ